jgi:TrmH family RNA methyltransferase
MITSSQNPKIKWVRELQNSSRARRQEGVFVIEGVRLVEEALAAGWQARLVLFSSDLSQRGSALLEGLAAQNAPLEKVAPSVLRSASDTITPQGILTVLERRHAPMVENPNFVFIPDQVRDPGNLGAMLRTAAAAGVQAVFIPSGAVDVFSPKVLRAGMGAHFRLPVYPLEWAEITAYVQALAVYLADVQQGVVYTQADWRAPLALIVGSEAEGASPPALSLATQRVHIPMPGGSESLNAAIAAGILLFECARQRSQI